MAESLAPIVAQHYNQIQEKGLEERKLSRIFHMRNLNNWIKSMLIKEIVEKVNAKLIKEDKEKFNVLDIGSGKGGDLLKWKKGNIDYFVCADIAETSVQQCRERYLDMRHRHKRQREKGNCFDAEFITADCTKERLKDKYKDSAILFNVVSCQFAFHYCFESFSQARMMLQNASECLKPGGFFIGSLPDSYEIMKRLDESEGCCFGNEVYSVTFPSKEKPQLFGAKYDFHLEGVVDCPEFLVYFPMLLKLAKEVDLELLFCKTFDAYFEEKQKDHEGKHLLTRMQALETYPPPNFTLMGCDEEYLHAKEVLKSKLTENQEEKCTMHAGTLSQSEWEVVSMYVVFAFVKKEKKKDTDS